MEPETLQLVGKCELQAAASGDGDKLPKVKILAYSGGPMRVSGFYDPLVIDLSGAKFAADRLPLIADHDVSQRLGHTTAQSIGRTITAEGVISSGSQVAKDLIADAKNGFPFQSSVGADIVSMERVREGSTADVNGREYTGPLNIVRRSLIREISITVLGADHKTSVSVAATRKTKPGDGRMSEHEDTGNVATIEAERERLGRVEAAFAQTAGWTHVNQNLAALRAKAVRNQVDEVELELQLGRLRQLEELRAGRPKMPDSPGQHFTNGVHGGRGDFAVLECAIAKHAGLGNLDKHYGPQAAEQAGTLGVNSMFDFCRHMAAQASGGYVTSRSKDETLKAAFSTIDTQNILSNVANKISADVFAAFPSVARLVARKLSAGDFREHTGVRLTGDATFQKVGASGEIKHGSLGDSKFTYGVDTFARMFGLTRKDIINDDLDAFSGTPRLLARGAALALEELFWALVIANANNFFSTAHGNLLQANSELGAGSLGVAVQAFLEQTDADGKPIACLPRYLVVPPALKVAGDELYASRIFNVGGADSTDSARVATANAHFGKYEPLPCPWIGAKGLAGGSDASWYLFGAASDVAAYGIAYLNGLEGPTIETVDQPADVLGIGWRGWSDFGVCEIDYQGALKATGAGSGE